MIIHVLGTAQDGGYPHAGCEKDCCRAVWDKPHLHRFPACIAAVDKKNKKYYLFDITPNVKEQIHFLESYDCKLAGIFITHAHVGHYMGLMDLGLEIMNLKNIPVYVMNRMKNFIYDNQPMRQLVKNRNINLIEIFDQKDIVFENFSVIPFEVPHRNELSETVGYKLTINQKSIIFIPDIDSWDKWECSLVDLVKNNDLLFIDGTFYNKNEIQTRDVSKIPHPEIIDTINKLSHLDDKEKQKVQFIHMNHTNKVLQLNSSEFFNLKKNNFNIVKENQTFNF
tara:strand:+ start:676 stop:1518 length:843 start_codon:yes stop_codon:yes gene_type:complete